MSAKKIVIVGAGAAGISAATRLYAAGFENLVILEAESRIGGRIHTIAFGENVVDMGAQWCHGEVENVVYQMAQPHNLLGTSKITDNRMTFIRSDGTLLLNTVGQRLRQLAESILDDEDDLKRFKGSLGDYFNQKFNVCLKRDEYSDIDGDTVQQFLEFYEKYQNLSNASSTWFDLSAEGFTHYEWCDGDLYLNWQDRGYRTLFDLLMRSFPDPRKALPVDKLIYFDKTVTKIDWSGSPPVRVTCSDDSTIDADHVIVTTSLGVLKERFLTMFTPELPTLKANAICGLAMGTVDKLYLEFKKPFWDIGFHGFSLLWQPLDRAEMLKNPQVSWLLDILGFYPVDCQPNVLCGWISGKNANAVEQLSDAVVQEGLLAVLRKFLTTYNVPVPIAMARTKWHSNPNFRGSYSYRSLSTDLLHISAADLAAPLLNAKGQPVVQFAGEATHDRFYSTVHGAVETGWREADRIIGL